MEKEKTLQYCSKLLGNIYTAESCLNCNMVIANKIVNDEKIIHEEFFYLAKLSLLYTGTIILCKVFDNDSDAITIKKILNIFKNSNLTNEQQAKFETFDKEYQENKIIIDKLKIQRDKFYAHNDKIDSEALLEKATVNHKEKMQLIQFVNRVISYSISVLKKEEPTFHVNIDKSTLDLKCVFDDLQYLKNNRHLILKNEFNQFIQGENQ